MLKVTGLTTVPALEVRKDFIEPTSSITIISQCQRKEVSENIKMNEMYGVFSMQGKYGKCITNCLHGTESFLRS
jgi:hypothetical protein